MCWWHYFLSMKEKHQWAEIMKFQHRSELETVFYVVNALEAE